jgi:drug/metabolite transporter (DMT)-like permease
LTENRATRFIPWLFVLLWASGFIVARLVRPYAEPESFVSLRFALSAAVLFVIAVIGGAHWPRTTRGWLNGLIAGALMQGVYVGSVFWSIKNGLPPALAALISGLQPLLTGMLATPLLGERVGRTRWIGIAIGFAGAVLVIAPNLSGTTAVPPIAVAACTFGMVGITLGTIWQKRIGGLADLRSGASLQFVGGLLVTVPLMLATEHEQIGNNINVWVGLGWAVMGLSVVTTMLLLWLIKGGAVAKIASLFYLVPPVTALMAFALFGEALAPIQFVGMAVAAAGVAIANRG